MSHILMQQVRTYISYHPLYALNKPVEHAENPDNTEDIEEHVCQGSTAGLRISRQRSQVRCNRCSDILTQHQSDTHGDRHGTTTAEQHGDSHHGCTRLHAERQHATHHQEDENRRIRVHVERVEETQYGLIMSQIHLLSRQTQGSQSQEQQAQSEEEVTDITVFLHIYQDNTQEESDV